MNGQQANIKTLEMLVTIIMGIALGQLVHGFIVGNQLNTGRLLVEVNVSIILCMVSTMVLMLRFYHGNIRMLEAVAQENAGASKNIRLIPFVDWLVTVCQGLLFCAVGFFSADSINFRWLVMAVFCVDVIWSMIAIIRRPRTDKLSGVREVARRWAAINVLTVMPLFVLQAWYISVPAMRQMTGILFGITVFAGSVADYWCNRTFLFPGVTQTTSEGAGD